MLMPSLGSHLKESVRKRKEKVEDAAFIYGQDRMAESIPRLYFRIFYQSYLDKNRFVLLEIHHFNQWIFTKREANDDELSTSTQ